MLFFITPSFERGGKSKGNKNELVGLDWDIEILGVSSGMEGKDWDILFCFEFEKHEKYLLSKSTLSDIYVSEVNLGNLVG